MVTPNTVSLGSKKRNINPHNIINASRRILSTTLCAILLLETTNSVCGQSTNIKGQSVLNHEGWASSVRIVPSAEHPRKEGTYDQLPEVTLLSRRSLLRPNTRKIKGVGHTQQTKNEDDEEIRLLERVNRKAKKISLRGPQIWDNEPWEQSAWENSYKSGKGKSGKAKADEEISDRTKPSKSKSSKSKSSKTKSGKAKSGEAKSAKAKTGKPKTKSGKSKSGKPKSSKSKTSKPKSGSAKSFSPPVSSGCRCPYPFEAGGGKAANGQMILPADHPSCMGIEFTCPGQPFNEELMTNMQY